jgi:hypothetical protein
MKADGCGNHRSIRDKQTWIVTHFPKGEATPVSTEQTWSAACFRSGSDFLLLD